MAAGTYFDTRNKIDRLRKNCLLLFITLGSLSVVGNSFPAYAQEQSETEEEVEEIVVTGSRIIRRDFASPSPVSTVGAEQIELSGNVTLEQVLNVLPQLQSNNTSNVNAPGGSGTLTADLRALGASRTLVLVNGRRFAPADTNGVVDLASIPQALIERVEVVTGGASAVYGSDAIAGVINFILKDDFEGVEASYGYGVTQRGDGETHLADITVGGNFAEGRGNAVLYTSYTEQRPVFQSGRSFSETAMFSEGGTLVPGGSSRVPGSVVFGENLVYPDGPPTVECNDPDSAQFREGGQPTPWCYPEDAYNFAAPNYLLRPRTRWQLSGTAHYELTDNIKAFSEVFYMNTRNNLQQAPSAVDFELVPGSRTLPVPLNNPLIPAVTRDFLAANFDEDADGIATLVGARRRFLETGPRQQIYDRNSFQIIGGLKGEIESYKWDLFYQFAQTSTAEEFVNLVSNLRVAQGLDVVVEDGTVRCRDETFGCVPINIFGYNSITPEAVDFLIPTAVTKTFTERHVLGGSVTGDLYELPAGPIGGAVGFEYRKEKASYRPDATVVSGELGAGSDAPAMAGSFDVWEAFAETRVPLLLGMPAVNYLGLEAAARYSRYSNVGSVWTFKAGGEWSPIADVRVRGLYQRAVRAPNLLELYQGQSSGATAYVDPCDVDENPTDAVRQFCIDQGVPESGIDNFQQDDVVIGLYNGNPELHEEHSNTYTIGAVVQPENIVPGLSLSFDYYSISVDDAIISESVQTNLDLCFDSMDLDNPYCQRINRISNGRISQIVSYNDNIARLSVKGLDVAAEYTFELPDLLGLAGEEAKLTTRLLASWQFERETVSDPKSPAVDCAGRFGDGVCSGQTIPIVLDFKALLAVDYRSGPLNVSLQGRYLGDVKPLSEGNVVDKINPHFYTDLAISYQIFENLELTGIVINLLDNDPPLLGFDNAGDTNTDPAVYDPLGRRFFVGARGSF